LMEHNSLHWTQRYCECHLLIQRRKEEMADTIEITAALNAGEDCSSSSLNSDGTELFLYKTDNYDGNIYHRTL